MCCVLIIQFIKSFNFFFFYQIMHDIHKYSKINIIHATSLISLPIYVYFFNCGYIIKKRFSIHAFPNIFQFKNLKKHTPRSADCLNGNENTIRIKMKVEKTTVKEIELNFRYKKEHAGNNIIWYITQFKNIFNRHFCQ